MDILTLHDSFTDLKIELSKYDIYNLILKLEVSSRAEKYKPLINYLLDFYDNEPVINYYSITMEQLNFVNLLIFHSLDECRVL